MPRRRRQNPNRVTQSTQIASCSRRRSLWRGRMLKDWPRQECAQETRTMNSSIRTLVLLVCLSSVPPLGLAQERRTPFPPATAHEQIQDCLRALWGEPVFWDNNAVAPVNPSVCNLPADQIDQTLKRQHVIAFRLSNAVLLANAWGFDQQSGALRYQWKTPEINIRVLPRVLPGGRTPTDAELREVADAVLKRSHLTPLTCPLKASEKEKGRLAFNILVWVEKLHVGSDQESAVALLGNSDPDHEELMNPGRLVYGDLKDGRFDYQWESPLVNTVLFQFGFANLLRNGNLQILLTSDLGAGRHTAFYAFDLDGREIASDNSTCGAFDNLSVHSAVACPIITNTGINVVDTSSGPKELVATDESGKKLRYVFRGGRYRRVSGPHSRPKA
jgi:hypothetical protein